MNQIKTKNYGDTFLYHQGEYERKLTEFLIKSTVIDKNDKSFENIRFEVKKRQTSSCISRVLDHPSVVLVKNSIANPRAFKVMSAADIKGGTKYRKVYIDVTEIVFDKNGSGYDINTKDVDKLVSYLISAMNLLIYFEKPNYILNKVDLTKSSTQCFASLFTYIIDYLRAGNVEKVREKCLYLSSLYYQINLLSKDLVDSVNNTALSISGLTKKEGELLQIQLTPNSFDNINEFIISISKIIRDDRLKVDNFIEKWMFAFGSGTHFGTELYIALASMLTNAYTGAYINNQKQIEKICGKNMVTFTNALLRVGSELF